MVSQESNRWSNRVAFVTGGNRGIGEAVVRRLVALGVSVVAFDKKIDRLKTLADEVKGGKGKVYPVQGDVRKEGDVTSAFQWVEANLGPVHILVNNAGIIAADSLSDGKTEGWRLVMDTNVMGLSMCTREAVRSMERHGFNEGHIFNINSICGLIVDSHLAPMYTASKFAVTALCEALRKELLAKGSDIRVTSICPGMVQTRLLASVPLPEGVWEKTLTPDDIAETLVFILSIRQSVHIPEIIIIPRVQVNRSALENHLKTAK